MPLALTFCACSKAEPGLSEGGESTGPVTLSMVDKNASDETKALYSNLWTIANAWWRHMTGEWS